MVRQGDVPVYYLRITFVMWSVLTRTVEVMGVNEPGKMCDVMRMVARIVKKKNNCSIIRQYLTKNSCKCIEKILKVCQIKMFNQKLQKKIYFFSEIFGV